MSNSPFEIFRRNLKPLMVFLTGLAMFAFVVLPVLDSYMRRNSGSGGDAVVARFEGVELTRSRVDYFTRAHQMTVRFLMELAQLTISRGDMPQTAGFRYDPQSGQILSIGINPNPSFEGSINTILLATEAQEIGFALDSGALDFWLEQFTAGLVSDQEIDALLMQSTQNQMGRPHLYEQLRSHLLANLYELRGYAGLFLDESNPQMGALMTPEEQWENFKKLNQNATISAYGVLVSEYLPKTNPTPSESEILATYEEGKNRDPSDQSPEPAFHRPYAASFEYLVANYQQFLTEEAAKIPEDVLRAEYEKRLKGGEFQLPDMPSTGSPDLNLNQPSDSETPASETPASVTSESSPAETTQAENEPADADSPADTDSDKPGSEQSDSVNETESSDAADSDAAEGNQTDSGSSEGEPTSDEGNAEPSESDQSRREPRPAVRLVTTVQDEGDQPTESSDPPPSQPDAETPEPETPASETEPETPEAEAQSPDAEAGDAKPDNEPQSAGDDTKPAGDESESMPAETPAAQPNQTSELDQTGESDQTSDSDQPDKPSEPAVETFESVRQRIAEELAAEAATQKMNQVLAEARSAMEDYFKRLAIYESAKLIGQEIKAPTKPDLKQLRDALAEKYGTEGLGYEEFGLYTAEEVRDEPISNSTEVGASLGMQATDWVTIMYGFNDGRTRIEGKPLFAPVETMDAPAGKQYLSWKIDEVEAYTPDLEEVREEVINAIRLREARQLAMEDTKKLAEQVNAKLEENPELSLSEALADLVDESKRDNIKENLGPFTWMQFFGFQAVTIGNVPELDSVGDDFMRAVFTTPLHHAAVAMNQPGRVVYVVVPLKFEPVEEELRRQFTQPTNRMMATMLLGNDVGPIVQEFYKRIEEEAGFVNYLELEEAE